MNEGESATDIVISNLKYYNTQMIHPKIDTTLRHILLINLRNGPTYKLLGYTIFVPILFSLFAM